MEYWLAIDKIIKNFSKSTVSGTINLYKNTLNFDYF